MKHHVTLGRKSFTAVRTGERFDFGMDVKVGHQTAFPKEPLLTNGTFVVLFRRVNPDMTYQELSVGKRLYASLELTHKRF